MFTPSFDNKKFPNSVYETSISLILKEGRDVLLRVLLNTDVKILTKLLANRLNEYVAIIVNAAHTGFILDRLSFFSVRI